MPLLRLFDQQDFSLFFGAAHIAKFHAFLRPAARIRSKVLGENVQGGVFCVMVLFIVFSLSSTNLVNYLSILHH